MLRLIRSAVFGCLFLSAAFTAHTAHASWLGLADGDYDVTLTTCASPGDPAVCTGFPLHGTITVAGAGLSAMSFVVDGVSFAGDPLDFVTDPFIQAGDVRERSRITHNPPTNEFFELMRAVGAVAPPERNQWIYCQDIPNSDSCTLQSGGTWVATPRSVPEPSVALLAGLGLIAFGVTRVGPRRPSRAPARQPASLTA